MTGKEAWSILAPILAMHMGMTPNDKSVLMDVYVTVFAALKEYDEWKEKNNE